MDDDCTNIVQDILMKSVNMYSSVLCSFQTCRLVRFLSFATSTITAECEVMEEEGLYPEQIRRRLEMERQEVPGAQR